MVDKYGREFVDLNPSDSEPLDNVPDPNSIIQFLLSALLMITSGFTIMCMWNWYIAPLGLNFISLFQAIGIDMLVTFIVTTDTSNLIKKKHFWSRMVTAFTFALMTLLIGWALHYFI